MVPVVGLEPTRYCYHWILSPTRLPIPPHRQEQNNYIIINIFLTRDTHHDNYMETQEGKNLPVPHCIENTAGWEIVDAVSEAVAVCRDADVKIINKPTFGSVELGAILREIYDKEDAIIDFCGVCTGICVISNVMIAKANCPEAEIRVFQDACACITPESHRTAIEAMRLCQVSII